MIAHLLPLVVITSEASPIQLQWNIFPAEKAFIQKAVPKRKREFTAGRLCVRKALAKIGITSFPVLVGNDGVPVWPSGVVGSISHCEGYCGVAIAQKPNIESIGLDVECVGQIKRDI